MNILFAVLLSSIATASSLSPRTLAQISVKGGTMYTTGPRTDTIIAGTPGKTLSLKSFMMTTSAGGSCSCYDASAPATTIVPFINMAANTNAISQNYQPGAVPVSAAGNSIKCTVNAATSVILECWEQ